MSFISFMIGVVVGYVFKDPISQEIDRWRKSDK